MRWAPARCLRSGKWARSGTTSSQVGAGDGRDAGGAVLKWKGWLPPAGLPPVAQWTMSTPPSPLLTHAGCPKAHTCTLVLRGGSEQFLDEADRSLHDAVMIVRRTLKSPLVVPGGGAVDMELSQHLRCAVCREHV